MDTAIQQIRQLTEQTLPFDDLPVPTVKNTIFAPTPSHTNQELVEIAAYNLENSYSKGTIIYAEKVEINTVDKLIHDNHGLMNF
jgi:hypothetical protein